MFDKEKRGFVYLAYIDDSGTDKPSPVLVVGAVIVRDTHFFRLDIRMGSIAESLVPEDKREVFEEFHASELFGGYNVFHGVPEEDRHKVISSLISCLPKFQIPFIYASVDKRLLDRSAFASSSALDIAFRLCAAGVGEWVVDQAMEGYRDDAPETRTVTARRMIENPFLLIADDTDERGVKQLLRNSFRSLRPPARKTQNEEANGLWMCHDDMFFGDSKSSIGIQLADVCTHIMFRHLRDGITDQFFNGLLPHAIAAKPEPFWDQTEAFMKTHEPALKTLADLAKPGSAVAASSSSSEPATPSEDQK